MAPVVLLAATLVAVVGLLAADSTSLLVCLGAPPVVALMTTPRGRLALGRRLLATGPLVVVAIVARSGQQVPALACFSPALRIVGAVAWSSWLTGQLGARDLGGALRALRVPPALWDLVAQTRRFSAQLGDTAAEAWNAAALRGGLSSVRAGVRTVGLVAGVVVVRAFDRAEQVAVAGALRGAHGCVDESASCQRRWRS